MMSVNGYGLGHSSEAIRAGQLADLASVVSLVAAKTATIRISKVTACPIKAPAAAVHIQ